MVSGLLVLGQTVLPSLEILLVAGVELVDVGVGDKFAELEVVVGFGVVEVDRGGRVGGQVELKVLGVVDEAVFEVVEVYALGVAKCVLVEVMDKGNLFGQVRIVPVQFVNGPLVGLCGDKDCAGDFVDFSGADETTALLLLNDEVKRVVDLGFAVGESVAHFIDSLLFDAFNCVVDFFLVACLNDHIED